MLSKSNERMLSLLASVLHNKKPEKISGEAWPAIYDELFSQAVYSLPAEYINDLGLSSDVQMTYLKAIINNRKIFHPLMKEQTWALSLLKENDILAVVVKGAAAAMYYPHPENRCMGDIDILVLPKDFEKAYEVLVSAGCKPLKTPEDFYRHIGMFTENDIEIELHNFFSCSDNTRYNKALDKILFAAIPSLEQRELCGYPVSMLPPLENGLVLLDHINHHISSGLGLRQIVDWMFYVEAVLDDDFWKNSFAKKADEIGLKRLAILVTAMCQKYLGLEKDIHWCTYEPVCDELMEYILAHGNFGRKVDSTKSRTVSVLKRIRNPIKGLAVAQQSGLINWKATQKYKILKPFAWIYQLIRWARRGIESGVTVNALSEASSTAKEATEFLKKLGVTRL